MRTFNFEQLAQLARTDPEAFERERIRLLRAAVEAAPPHQKERAEQTFRRIQAMRSASRTPLESALLASRAMCASLEELQDAMNGAVAVMAIEKARISSAGAVAALKTDRT
jgi:hypothetical protein